MNGITTVPKSIEKTSPLTALAAKVMKTLLALAIAISTIGIATPKTAYAWTGNRTLSFQTGGGWTTPSVTLRQSKSTSQLRSLFKNRTTTKKYYNVYRVYVDGKYRGKFDSASKKIKLPRNGRHTIRIEKDGWASASRAGKTGFVQTNNPSYYWECTNWKNVKSR